MDEERKAPVDTSDVARECLDETLTVSQSDVSLFFFSPFMVPYIHTSQRGPRVFFDHSKHEQREPMNTHRRTTPPSQDDTRATRRVSPAVTWRQSVAHCVDRRASHRVHGRIRPSPRPYRPGAGCLPSSLNRTEAFQKSGQPPDKEHCRYHGADADIVILSTRPT